MPKRNVPMFALLAALVLTAAPAAAQAPSPEAKEAAREFVDIIRFNDQFKAMMPMILTNMKPSVVQGRAEVARDYDAFMPVLLKGMQDRLGDLKEAVVVIYANNFTVEQLRGIVAFYKGPIGQAYLEKMVPVSQQTMTAGQEFGKIIGAEAQKQMIEQMRKKGHAI